MYARDEGFGPHSSVLSDNALIQALEQGSDVLLERGERQRAAEAQRAASGLRESLRLYREAVGEVVRCGKRTKSPDATPDDAVATELAQAVMRNRWAVVEDSRERGNGVLDACR